MVDRGRMRKAISGFLTILLVFSQISCLSDGTRVAVENPAAASGAASNNLSSINSTNQTENPSTVNLNNLAFQETISKQNTTQVTDLPKKEQIGLPNSTNSNDVFNLVVLPDTQFYSERHPDTFISITKWIAGEWQAERFDFVVHLGDIVNNDDRDKEWGNAVQAMSLLGNHPFTVLPETMIMFTVQMVVVITASLISTFPQAY